MAREIKAGNMAIELHNNAKRNGATRRPTSAVMRYCNGY
jgi:hypothetical protein